MNNNVSRHPAGSFDSNLLALDSAPALSPSAIADVIDYPPSEVPDSLLGPAIPLPPIRPEQTGSGYGLHRIIGTNADFKPCSSCLRWSAPGHEPLPNQSVFRHRVAVGRTLAKLDVLLMLPGCTTNLKMISDQWVGFYLTSLYRVNSNNSVDSCACRFFYFYATYHSFRARFLRDTFSFDASPVRFDSYLTLPVAKDKTHPRPSFLSPSSSVPYDV